MVVCFAQKGRQFSLFCTMFKIGIFTQDTYLFVREFFSKQMFYVWEEKKEKWQIAELPFWTSEVGDLYKQERRKKKEMDGGQRCGWLVL